MLTDWRPIEKWNILNRELTEKLLGEESKQEIRLYQGAEHAIWEVTQGLSRLFPHRRKVLYFQYQDPFHDHAIFTLLRDGFEVISLPIDQIDDPKSWQDQIGKDTLMFLYSEDDPILGRRFNFEGVPEICDKNKAFAVKVSHHCHLQDEWLNAESPFAVDIKSFRSDLAVAHLGSKAKIGSAIAPFLEWEAVDVTPVIDDVQTDFDGFNKKVQGLEAAVPGGGQPLWKKGVPRLFDRAVLFWEDMDGHAIIDSLAFAMGWILQEPGYECRLETTSLSRWGGLRTMDWLKHQGMTAEQIRGTIVIHASVISDQLIKALDGSLKRVRELQGF
ncbi:MAG: hypothetical protein H6624_10230 [Bdellovibrionaceae bacterium]|nr:hypothetical protein [Bdellovibrionales bacterium]MCB9084711.1 hypothetical protein [Pseudobdellovibrionaceae bacterium]